MATWLVIAADGAARRVGNLGLLIGRAPMCDLVLDHAEVSRRHALLQHAVRGGLDVIPMAGARTTLNAAVIERAVAACDQDVLGFPGGATLRLACTDAPAAQAAPWLLEVGGRRIGYAAEIEPAVGGDEIVIEDCRRRATPAVRNDARGRCAMRGLPQRQPDPDGPRDRRALVGSDRVRRPRGPVSSPTPAIPSRLVATTTARDHARDAAHRRAREVHYTTERSRDALQ